MSSRNLCVIYLLNAIDNKCEFDATEEKKKRGNENKI